MRKNLQLLVLAFCVVVNNVWAQKLELSTKTINACSQTTVQVCATTYQPYVINSAQQDDFFTDTVQLGFNFSYFGQQFSAIVISPNNLVSFDLALANLYSEWEYGSALNTGQLNKAIMFPFQDLHIGGAIRYKMVGTAPNRKFVIEFCQVPFYFCLANTTTNQLILHETSNVIEMHIASKPYCAGWSGSNYASAIQGIKSGTNEVFVAGRGPNAGAWSVGTPEARRFSPNGSNSYTVSNIAYDPITLIEPGNGNFQWFAGNSTTPFATTACAGITTSQNINYYVVKYTGSNQSCNPAANGTITDTVYVNHDEVVETTTLTFCRDQLPAQWRGITIPNTATTTNNYDSVWVNGVNGACDTNFILSIIVNDYQPAQFSPVGTICSGTTFSLPATSNNGISGTWSPAINNMATTTYTFTPGQGQCGLPVSMTVTVLPSDTPFFNQVDSICAGGTLAPLPTTSLNGISGTWSPALNNTQTTIYTFTPANTGTCIISPTMTIGVNPVKVPVFDQVMPICSGGPLNPLPTTSNNGITGTWSPAINSNVTTTYTFTPDPGQGCVSSTTMTIIVNDTNTVPAFWNPQAYCAGYVFTLPNVSQNGIEGTWSPAYDYYNTTTYTFTPNPGQCGDTVSMTIEMVAFVVPNFTQVPPVCLGATMAPLPTTSNNGIQGNWSPELNNTSTTTYTFQPHGDFCSNPVTMTIVVDSGMVPVFSIVDSVCEGTTVSPLPTTSQNGITGTWSPAFNGNTPTTYTFIPASQCASPVTHIIGIIEKTEPVFTQILPICQGEPLSPFPTTSLNGVSGTWSPAPNNMATTTYTFTPDTGFCATTTTMTVLINSNGTLPIFDSIPNMCIGTVMSPLPTTSLNGINGIWSPAFNNTQTTSYTFTPVANSCGIPTSITIIIDTLMVPSFNPVDPICIGAPLNPLPLISNNGLKGNWSPALNNTQTTTYTFTPIIGQCAVPTTMTIVVDTGIVPVFTAVPAICEGATLSPLPTISNNNITGTWSPALNNTATTTYTFIPDAGQCAAVDTLTIVVNPIVTPVFTQVNAICAGDTLNPLPATSNNNITGTWSPAFNNTTTTTYTFTPAAGQCATTVNMTIVVNAPPEPTFTIVAPICEGGILNPLPLTSQNGITGTWSPALNNGATTTYTFTPTAGQCADSATLTITVTPNTIPQFTQVNAICAGTALSPLPTTSLNGVSGTWSPALNNTATTTYTFTPTAGQCATTTTMTINVNNGTVPAFTQVAAICAGATLNPLPTTSNNNINGTWSPAPNNTATTTYTFTPDAGQCALTTTMTITVTPNVTPTFAPVAPICIGGALNPLPTTSQNGVSGTWSPALNNVQTTTYTFTPTAGLCATTASMTITVETPVTPAFAAVPAICEGTVMNPLPLTSQNGITGTWSPALNNTATTTYTFIPNAGQCATPTTLTIPVTPNLVPQFTQVNAICAGATLNPLPTTSLNGVTGTWAPALNNIATTTYTFTPTAGQCATATTMTINVNNGTVPAFTQVSAICAGATLNALPLTSNNNITGTWSPALNNTATTTYTFTPTAGQCALTTTMTIVVTPNVTPTFAPVAPICTGATLSPLPATSQNGVTGTWSPSLNNTATTTYTFTPAAGQCATTTSMTITVDTAVVPVFTPVASICQGSSLSPLSTTSNNGITGTWSPALNNNATTTYTFTPAAGQCAAVTTLTITVTPNTVAQFTQVAPICTGGTLSPLPTTSLNGVTGTWSPALNNTATTTYTFTPTAGTGNCWTGTTMQIVINPYLTGNRNVTICSGNSYTFNGTTYTSSISGVKDTVSNLNSCDSIITLNLTVNPVTNGVQYATICAGNSYTFNGQVYSTSNNSAQDTLVNQYGCDSIVTLNLTVIPVNPVTDTVRLTDCGSVVYAGNTYTASTHLVDTIYNVNGCDSIYKHVLINVNPVYNFKETVHVRGCKEATYKGVRYDQSTVFEEVIQTVNGCDSLVNTVVVEINDFKLKAYMNPEAPFKGENVQILTYSVDNVPYSIVSWEPAILFPNQTATEQRVKLENPIRIVITGVQGGCQDTALIDITEFPGYSNEVKVPSAFSPNGDGLNDVFAPVLRIDHGYSVVAFKVYSRYGELVHSTSNMSGGWDGTYKGRLQDAGVYYYMIKIKFLDGTEKFFKGDVTLLK